MNYESISKNKLPRKFNDINNIRCFVHCINEHYHIESKDLKVNDEKFASYFNVLIKNEIIIPISNNCSYNSENYSIRNIEKTMDYFT